MNLSRSDTRKIYLDTAVYVQRTTNNKIVILAIHVDNVLSFGNSSAGLKLAWDQLHKTFAMKEEDCDWVMGFQLVENQAQCTIAINHRQYIDTLLCHFNMHECKPIDMPLDHAIVLLEWDCPTMDNEKATMRN